MDETVVRAASAWRTTARMKREDANQGSWSEAVDERGRSLVMDGGVGVSAPAWWRRTVVGAAPTRWTTAGMKREDGMQGSRSEAVDERGRSLVMDGEGVLD